MSPAPSIIDSFIFKILAGLIAGFLVLVYFNLKCTSDITRCKNYELNRIKIDRFDSDKSLIECVIKIIKINRKYDKHHAKITYTYWSYIGMILAAGYGFLCEYLTLDGNYAQPAIPVFVVTCIIFVINMFTVAWRLIAHSREIVEKDGSSQQELGG